MLKRILLVTLLAASPLFAKDVSPQQRAEAMIDKATDYLKSKQLPDGAWHTGPQPPAISAVVLKALVQHPRYDHNTDFIKRGYERLLTHQLENGGIYRDMLANYNTAIAISALAAAENPEFK